MEDYAGSEDAANKLIQKIMKHVFGGSEDDGDAGGKKIKQSEDEEDGRKLLAAPVIMAKVSGNLSTVLLH